MGEAYVRIPVGKRLEFPPTCPFTGSPDPHGRVRIQYPRIRWRIPIPILGSIWMKPVTYVRIPACKFKANLEQSLTISGYVLAIILIVCRVVARGYSQGASQSSFAPRTTQPIAADSDTEFLVIALLALVGIYFLVKLVRFLNLRAVTIVDRDSGAAELRFTREDYAREFCALNNLNCHDTPYRQRRKQRSG